MPSIIVELVEFCDHWQARQSGKGSGMLLQTRARLRLRERSFQGRIQFVGVRIVTEFAQSAAEGLDVCGTGLVDLRRELRIDFQIPRFLEGLTAT